MPNDVILHFDVHRFDVVQRGGTIWFRSGQIVPALGLTERSIRKVFDRHREQFGPDDTVLLPLPTSGGMQEVRVFSLSGVMMLAMYARTEQAMHFHRWLLDVATGKKRLSAPRQGTLALPPAMPMGTEARRLAEHIRGVATDPTVIAELDALLGGSAALPPDPSMEALIADMQEVRRHRAAAAQADTAWRRRVRLAGYDPDAVLRAAQRAAGRPSQQSPLLDA